MIQILVVYRTVHRNVTESWTKLVAYVVYFNQQTGALHAVPWSKPFFGILTSFSLFFHHKQEKRRKSTKNKEKILNSTEHVQVFHKSNLLIGKLNTH